MRALRAALVPQFQADVLDIIGRTQDGEAISYLLDELRCRGWKGIGSISNFEDMLEEAGFDLRRVYTNGTCFLRATYVTLGKAVQS